MINFFKTFGKGILYVLGLPLLIIFLAVYLVISIIGFIITGFRVLFLFFKGESLKGVTPEDEEAAKRLDMWLNPIPHIMNEVNEIKKQQQLDMEAKRIAQDQNNYNQINSNNYQGQIGYNNNYPNPNNQNNYNQNPYQNNVQAGMQNPNMGANPYQNNQNQGNYIPNNNANQNNDVSPLSRGNDNNNVYPDNNDNKEGY